jgi:hypothetical protein
MWVQNRELAIEALLGEFEQAIGALSALADDSDDVRDSTGAPESLGSPEPMVAFEPPRSVDAAAYAEPEFMAKPVIAADSAAVPEADAFLEPAVAAHIPASRDSTLLGDEPASLSEYVAWQRVLGHPLDEVSDAELDELLVEIVSFEGPLHAELAYRRVVKACGGSKLGSRVKERLDEALKRLLRRARVRVLKDGIRDPMKRTLYAPGHSPVVPRSAGDRGLEDVPWSELATVSRMFDEDMDQEGLMRAVLALYGRKSLTGQAETLLAKAFGCTWEPE